MWPEHQIHERDPDGGFTVRYVAGPKRGMLIHFFAAEELDALFRERFKAVLPLRLASTPRQRPAHGRWP